MAQKNKLWALTVSGDLIFLEFDTCEFRVSVSKDGGATWFEDMTFDRSGQRLVIGPMGLFCDEECLVPAVIPGCEPVPHSGCASSHWLGSSGDRTWSWFPRCPSGCRAAVQVSLARPSAQSEVTPPKVPRVRRSDAGTFSLFDGEIHNCKNNFMISFDDFKKVELRTARVLEAARVEGSEKLLKIKVSLGQEERQIIAGIGKAYDPAALVGKNIVVVANLEPRNLMGLESRGMLLAASGENGPAILVPEREIPPGTEVR